MTPRRIDMLLKLMLTVFLLHATVLPSGGAHHAVLIGIKNYPHVTPLHGPLNDVDAIQELLVEQYGFTAENVTVLRDVAATKQTILSTLAGLERRTRPGDFVFVFFSGHGTSDYDKTKPVVIGRFTGAILPYDFRLSPDNLEQTLDRLIIGRRDLRPLFQKLDRDRTLLVVFDACFSGNTVRAPKYPKGIPKFFRLTFPDATGKAPDSGPIEPTAPFPYRNLIYISASDENELAIDLPSDARYDGKAHGALTDALLMGLSGDADTNRNRVVSYTELYRFAKDMVQTYGHRPRILYRSSLDRPVFEKPEVFVNMPLRVSLRVGRSASLERRLAARTVRVPTNAQYDLLVVEEEVSKHPAGRATFSLFLPGGDRLCRVNSEKGVAERIERFAKVREFTSRHNPRQSFNLRLRAGGREGRTVFTPDDTTDFSIDSEADAYLVMVKIDCRGYLSVLLPDAKHPVAFIPSGGRINLAKFVVSPPFGVEFLKLFAFADRVEEISRYASNRDLEPGSSGFKNLLQLIEAETRSGNPWAETSIQVVTIDPLDLLKPFR